MPLHFPASRTAKAVQNLGTERKGVLLYLLSLLRHDCHNMGDAKRLLSFVIQIVFVIWRINIAKML